MSYQFKRYKRTFRFAFQPVFAVILAKRDEMNTGDWHLYLTDTVNRILKNPSEYLGQDLPPTSLRRDIMDEIVDEFVKETSTYRKGK